MRSSEVNLLVASRRKAIAYKYNWISNKHIREFQKMQTITKLRWEN
jgi:hypothetical protein